MGYGDGDETTLLYPGPGTGNYPTYYFRKVINISNPALYPGGLQVKVKRDDAIIFYVNGIELYRNNTHIVNTYTSLAVSSCVDDGYAWINLYVPPGLILFGNNIIAAEVHQFENIGGDLSYDCAIIGLNSSAPICTRKPYLQSFTPTSAVVKWRTNISSNSVVYIGNSYNIFTDTIVNFVNTYNHEVNLSGLSPATKYYYAVGSTLSISELDTTNYFYTPGPMGVPYELDVWITGDCGTGFGDQVNTANAFSSYIGNKYIDSWMLLGDNAYNNGFDAEYQSNFFDVYNQYRFMSQTCIWPTPGNHDYYTTSNLDSRNTPYFQIFTVPTAGEAGGIPSNTESYYSYNLSNAHFISLDSYGTENSQKMYDTTSLQALWLKQDLAANTQPWTILYWHHPPFTMGSHNSDVETDLVALRSNLIKMLERFKVDLVLCGHSHQYERSKLIKGHYGLEPTFDTLTHLISNSSACYDGSTNSCPYYKKTADILNTGLVYMVAGSSGKVTTVQASWPHDIMYYSNTANTGSVYLKINNNRLDASFISSSGIVQDKFTMMKDVNNHFDLLVPPLTPINLSASWIGNYYWPATGDTINSILMNFNTDSIVIVEDNLNCVADTFYVTVGYAGEENTEIKSIKIYPNPTESNFTVELPFYNQPITVELFTTLGGIVFKKKWFTNTKNNLIEPGNISRGAYSVKISIGNKIFYSKLIFN